MESQEKRKNKGKNVFPKEKDCFQAKLIKNAFFLLKNDSKKNPEPV